MQPKILIVEDEGPIREGLKDKLEAEGRIDELGGVEALVAIMEAVPSAANVADYAEIVRDRAQKRALITIANQVIEDSYGGAREAKEIVELEVMWPSTGAVDRFTDVPLDSLIRVAGIPMLVVFGVESSPEQADDVASHDLPGHVGKRGGFVQGIE